jgi:2-polyprenyl-6-methoxyphenol hydroxylase-like FAD-dependent oxidoreductase
MSNGFPRKTSPIGKHAVVIGAGMSGLAAAQALVSHFEEVTVIERDELSSGAIARTGVPQGKQAHALLGGGIKALEELFPGFARDIVQAGAVVVDPGFDALLEYPNLDPFPRSKWNWFIYSLTRPLIELSMRRRLEQQSNVTLRGGRRAQEIVGTPDGALVTGVRVETPDGNQETIPADLVIDASRHGALTLSFLRAAGQPVPEVTTIGVDIRYGTGLFALCPGALNEFKAVVTFPEAPENVHYGYLIPVENACYQLLLVGRGEDAPPTDGRAFLDYAQNLSTPTIYDAMKGAKPLSDIARYGFPESKWRHFGRLDRFPRGLLPTGDAICRLNPVYGQGITVAAQEANTLRRLLSTHAATGDPLATLAREFLAEAEALIEQPWAISAIPDFIYPQTRGQRPEDLEYRLKSQLALMRIAARDASVYKLLSEVRHLLKPLTVLDETELVRRVEAEMARQHYRPNLPAQSREFPDLADSASRRV